MTMFHYSFQLLRSFNILWENKYLNKKVKWLFDFDLIKVYSLYKVYTGLYKVYTGLYKVYTGLYKVYTSLYKVYTGLYKDSYGLIYFLTNAFAT
jgi:hypothetical protein